MNRLVIGTSLAVSLLAGCTAASPSAAPTQGTASYGGVVQYRHDGGPATTEVDAVADGASISGTAVTTLGSGTHTVRLACAAQDGGTWALGGTVEESTVESGSAGAWSAVIVKEGSPQQIGIWLSDDPSAASDCEAWLAAIDVSTIDAENFSPVESGALVPPPDSAP
jgi:hypothetical protein